MKNSMETVRARQKNILKYLQANRSERVRVLSEIFGVTPITVRRDLEQLEKEGYVRREFGAVICTLPPDTDVKYRMPQGDPTPTSKSIARAAARFVEEGDLVFFNSSSTVSFMLEYLNNLRATVITNNGRALYANRAPGVDLFLTGGEVYGQKQSLVGEVALSTLSKMTASKCFLGVSGISAVGGITSLIMQETAINQQMLKQTVGPKIVVAVGSKIGTTRSFFSGRITEITHLVTDNSADPLELERLRKAGVEVILADSIE